MPASVAREWRTTLDGMRDAVCLINRDGRIRRCNEAMRKFLGKPYDAIVGQNCWKLIYGTRQAPRGCAITSRRRGKREIIVTRLLQHRWYQVSTDLIRDQQQRVVGGVHILADITELKRAEAHLQEYGRRLDLLHRIDRAILDVRHPAHVAADALRRLVQLAPGLIAGVTLFNLEAGQAELLAVANGRRGGRVGLRMALHDRWVHALRKGEAGPVPGMDAVLSTAQRRERAAGDPRCQKEARPGHAEPAAGRQGDHRL